VNKYREGKDEKKKCGDISEKELKLIALSNWGIFFM